MNIPARHLGDLSRRLAHQRGRISAAWLGGLAGVVLALAPSLGQAQISAKTVAYFGVGNGSSSAYLIDWLSTTKARVVAGQGVRSGAVATAGATRTITLNKPLSASNTDYDSCGIEIQRRYDLLQVIVRDVSTTTSEVVEIGQLVNVGGCEDGLTEPVGTPSDPGLSVRRLKLGARPSVADLVPGTQVAGFSEDVLTPGVNGLAEDVVTLQAGSAVFARSGNVVPAVFDANNWLVFDFGSFQRGYTRVFLDNKTGGETWLLSDWAAGQPLNVQSRLMVKPAPGAGFGTTLQAARMWESGLFIGTNLRFYFYLYKDGSGQRVQKDLVAGTEIRTPLVSWALDGANLVQNRAFPGLQLVRTWQPLANTTTKIRWVLENETLQEAGGSPVPFIKPRVSYVVDTGKAVAPASVLAD